LADLPILPCPAGTPSTKRELAEIAEHNAKMTGYEVAVAAYNAKMTGSA
jgi:predicted dienelactone hydrolase